MAKFNRDWGSGLSDPAAGGFAITKSDTTVFAEATRAIYVGGTGDLAVRMIDGSTVTLKNVPVGVLPLRCDQVLATGTTASDLVGLY